MPRRRRIRDEDYARLLAVRTGLRRFERWSAEQAAAQGLTPTQHQLLLAVRGHPEPAGPTVGQAASYLFIRHHSAVELVDRTVQAGLVSRAPDADDHRSVRLRLTTRGTDVLGALTDAHLQELENLGALFADLTTALVGAPTSAGDARRRDAEH